LREAEEEIGLKPALVEPLGYLDLYLTFSGFRIMPTVARIAPDFELTLNRSEVAEVFEVPLEYLMRPENYRRKSRDWNGIIRHYYEIPYRNRYIWGVTAGILRNLHERIYRE
jgi:8-oxo-dGTP pyrophosphatase MutT (NUDIX family)